MEVNMLLCDYAEVIGGKLYITGGGWNICSSGIRDIAVAVRVDVPWSEANIDHVLSLHLQDDSGHQVEMVEPAQPVRFENHFQVGRPPNVPQGWDLDFSAVVSFKGLELEAGRIYRWQLEIDGEPTKSASFITREQ